jgi:hypothetical protein
MQKINNESTEFRKYRKKKEPTLSDSKTESSKSKCMAEVHE